VTADTEYVDPETGEALEEVDGGFRNRVTNRLYPVIDGIPRFVDPGNYADNFGDQWNAFRTTQLDRKTQVPLTRQRLYRGTEWMPAELTGKRLLEIGCGAGRFTEQFLAAGAEVWAVDYSNAVEACYANHGANATLHLAQADVYHLPFAEGSFDYVFMYGVLQHTPDPLQTLRVAVTMARPNGGKVAADCYVKSSRNRWTSKYRWRWLTTRLPPRRLRALVTWYVPRWIRVDDWLGRRNPALQRRIARAIPCWNYRGIYPLDDRQLVEWAVLDTYDALGAQHDRPFGRLEMARVLNEYNGIQFSIKRGGIGIEVNITRMATA
jgi:SAM-dependent methyltransferase